MLLYRGVSMITLKISTNVIILINSINQLPFNKQITIFFFKYIAIGHRITISSIDTIDDDAIIMLDPKNVQISDGGCKFSTTVHVNHSNLLYEVTIASKVENSKFGSEGWSSESEIVNFTTKPSIPDHPPLTEVGAFFVVEPIINCEVNIFWEELKPEEFNGPDFEYVINVYKNKMPWKEKTEKYFISRSTARFDEICLDNDYEFRIYSKNLIGTSLKYSSIYISYGNELIESPVPIAKHLINKSYILKWNQPQISHLITNYTIAWCEPMDEQYNLCASSVSFINILGNSINYTFNNKLDEKTKIFAISANTANSSSGLVWFPCTASIIGDMTKLPLQLKVLGSDSIEVSWNLKCDTTLMLKRFILSYCPVNTSNIGKIFV